jgi:plasmid stability protein
MSTLVIKNLPEPLHDRLRSQAERNHRSVTKEALRLIETGLATSAPQKPLPEPISLRSGRMLTAEEIETAINEGRE